MSHRRRAPGRPRTRRSARGSRRSVRRLGRRHRPGEGVDRAGDLPGGDLQLDDREPRIGAADLPSDVGRRQRTIDATSKPPNSECRPGHSMPTTVDRPATRATTDGPTSARRPGTPPATGRVPDQNAQRPDRPSICSIVRSFGAPSVGVGAGRADRRPPSVPRRSWCTRERQQRGPAERHPEVGRLIVRTATTAATSSSRNTGLANVATKRVTGERRDPSHQASSAHSAEWTPCTTR